MANPTKGQDVDKFIKDAAGRSTPKPGFNPATALPGKPMYMTDRDDKPWMAVTFHQLR